MIQSQLPMTSEERVSIECDIDHRWTDVTRLGEARRIIVCFDCDGVTFEAGPAWMALTEPLCNEVLTQSKQRYT
jgi:hypothetical protein